TAAPVKAATLSGTANWIEYHHDRSRRGVDPSQPNFSTLSPSWTNSTLTGQIYASPLVYNGSVYIATEDNVIYALDPATGTVQWSKTLSTPFDSSGLPCGNVSPHVGITGTPVIDPSLNRIFAVGMVSTGHYVLWTVDSDTVIVFNPNLTKKHQFTPANRSTLDSTDADLNSIAPGLVGNGNVLQSGKSGDSYLLSSTLARHQGPTHVCTGLTNSASFGATAYQAPYIYIPCENALYAVTETATSFSAAWHYDGPTATSPIIAGGAVLILDGGGNTLTALNPTTGAVIDSVTTSA